MAVPEPGVRLVAWLARAGVASRRAAAELVRAGRVTINGRVVTELHRRVGPGEVVAVDGNVVPPLAPVWVALHKPPGVLTARRDPRGQPTVYDLLPARFRGLFHVGRLDRSSEGLLLLTNEGLVAHRLLHPRWGVTKTYRVRVGPAPPDLPARLVAGVVLDDGPARARAARWVGHRELELDLAEGRKREIRRMLAALGVPVRRLVRLRFGPVRLGSLPPGRWRRLRPAEVAALRRAVTSGQSQWTSKDPS